MNSQLKEGMILTNHFTPSLRLLVKKVDKEKFQAEIISSAVSWRIGHTYTYDIERWWSGEFVEDPSYRLEACSIEECM